MTPADKEFESLCTVIGEYVVKSRSYAFMAEQLTHKAMKFCLPKPLEKEEKNETKSNESPLLDQRVNNPS